MEHDFWRERWETGRTAWHQDDAHAALVEYWPSLGVPADSAVFVPLCGASMDMAWLAEQGHRVVGSELSEVAVRQFFDQVGLEPDEQAVGDMTLFTAGPYELWCGDHFELSNAELGGVAAVYDRASLVALPPGLRRRYAAHLADGLNAGVISFLLTFVYDQSEMEGPPFSVSSAEVEELFGDRFDIEHHSAEDVAHHNADLMARGLSRVHEEIHVLRRRP